MSILSFMRGEQRFQPALKQKRINPWPPFTIQEVIGATDEWLEDNHGWVQMCFPMLDAGLEPNAPPVEAVEIINIGNDKTAGRYKMDMLARILFFYGITIDADTGNYRRVNNEGLVRCNGRDHNRMRMDRILRSMRLFGLNASARQLYALLERENGKGGFNPLPATRGYWADAMGEPIPNGAIAPRPEHRPESLPPGPARKPPAAAAVGGAPGPAPASDPHSIERQREKAQKFNADISIADRKHGIDNWYTLVNHEYMPSMRQVAKTLANAKPRGALRETLGDGRCQTASVFQSLWRQNLLPASVKTYDDFIAHAWLALNTATFKQRIYLFLCARPIQGAGTPDNWSVLCDQVFTVGNKTFGDETTMAVMAYIFEFGLRHWTYNADQPPVIQYGNPKNVDRVVDVGYIPENLPIYNEEFVEVRQSGGGHYQDIWREGQPDTRYNFSHGA